MTVERGSQSSDFFLGDKTGRVLVKFRGGVSPDLSLISERKSGRYRYTEWRIDPNENIYAFAMAMKMLMEHSIYLLICSGSYTPILSNDGALENRASWGTKGIMFSALGISLFCFGCLYSCFFASNSQGFDFFQYWSPF